MNELVLEMCNSYDITEVNGVPVIVFDDHNMALPVWGTFSSRNNCSYNLVTFDSHTDTHAPFNLYLYSHGIEREFDKSALEIPIIKRLLQNCKYKLSNFHFEDVFKLSSSYLRNSEHILTAYAMEYIKSYTIIHRENGYRYEYYDRLNGLDARYIDADNLTNTSIDVRKPLALDFDIDFFRSTDDLDSDFFRLITPLIKNANVITIAREPECFTLCKTDLHFTLREAEAMLIDGIKSILSQK